MAARRQSRGSIRTAPVAVAAAAAVAAVAVEVAPQRMLEGSAAAAICSAS
jgi:hypothetical protein